MVEKDTISQCSCMSWQGRNYHLYLKEELPFLKYIIILTIPFKAAEVMMIVQSIERTFVDKVFAVCDYKIQNMQDRDSRHLYDICKLLREVELNDKK